MTRPPRPGRPSPLILWGLLLLSGTAATAAVSTGHTVGLLASPAAWGTALAAAAAARLAGAVTTAGAAAGTVLAGILLAATGWPGLLLLTLFVAGSSAATRLGAAGKSRLPRFHQGAGRRGHRNVLANGGAAGLLALAAASPPSGAARETVLVAMAACLAAAFSDTISSEIGQVLGRRPVRITSFEPAEPGSDGAVSLAGTLWGAGASAAMGSLAWATGLVPAPGAAAVAVGGLAGNLADSLLGATLERKGRLDNDAVNYLATLAGAAVAAALRLGWS